MEVRSGRIVRLGIVLAVLVQLSACDDVNNSGDSGSRFQIGGTVSGLTGDSLVLQNNAADDITITTDGSFVFSKDLSDGTAYSVTIATQPSGQKCTVDNGTGTLSDADVTNVRINCYPDAVPPSVTSAVSAAGAKLLRFTWNDVGADHYKLLSNPDGISGYSQIGEDIRTTSVDQEISVHLTDWVNTSYIVQACNAAQECTDSAAISANSLMLEVIGYLKAPNTDQTTAFGSLLALSDDATTLAIASSSGVHIFLRDGEIWSQQALLDINSDSLSLSSNGDTLAVGDRQDDSAATGVDGDQTDVSAQNSGAVYIFNRSGTSWSQQAYIKASNTESNDGFGSDLALSADGHTLAVVAREEDSAANGIDGEQTDNSATDAGAAYLFVLNGSTWSQQAYIKASNTNGNDSFGWDVALSTNGDTLAVGSRAEDSSAVGINGDETDNSAFNAGAVYLFTRSGTSWTQQAYIKASNSDAGDMFGSSVALSGSGDLLAVGATNEDSSAQGINSDQTDNSASIAGAVYLFERNANVWTQTAYIKSSNTEKTDVFGRSVVLSADGTTLAVRSSAEDSIAAGINGDQTDNSAFNAGAVYLFLRSGGSWRQQSYVKASNTYEGSGPQICSLLCFPENAEFGSGLGLSTDGTTLAVGAFYEASVDQNNQQDHSSPGKGAVYLY